MAKNKKRKPKKKRSTSKNSTGGKSGVMMGMRGGFKTVAKNVTGKNEKKSKSSWFDLLLNIALIGAVVFLAYRLFFK